MQGLIAERPPRYGRKDADSIPEKLLSRLWKQRAERQESFRTAAGSRIRVIYSGREGTAAGPDFRDAILEIEGQGLVRGDVELHVRQKDWRSHGHSSDPNYNGVVLHAALEVDSESTGLQSGQETPVVSLAQLLNSEDLDIYGGAGQTQIEPENEPGGGAASGMGLWALLDRKGYARPKTAAEAGAMLDRAGDQRFHSNSRWFQSILAEQRLGSERPGGGHDQSHDDQTLYEGLKEGLGYKNNQQPFLKLAQRAPWRVLAQRSGDLPDRDRAAAVQGWLSAVSGLAATSDSDSGPGPGMTASTPRGLGPSMSRKEWRLSGLRPANHPLRRMAGAASLVERYSQTGLAASLDRAARSGGAKALTACLTAGAGPGARTAAVGQGRARDLAINVALPFLFALSDGGDEAYLDLYRSYGRLQENELTREMARLLLDSSWGPLVTSARRQQGLIHLHRVLIG